MGLDSSDVSSSELLKIIRSATTQLNMDINAIIVEERVDYIDAYRENKIDGSNATFYVQTSYNSYLGDYDNDGGVGITDAIVYLYNTSTRLKSTPAITSVDHASGSITLTAAPASANDMTITYSQAPLDESTPHRAIKEACKALAASLAYMKVRGDDYKKLDLGDFSIEAYTGSQTNNRPFMVYLQYYHDLVDMINSGELINIDDIPGLPFLLGFPQGGL